MQDIFVVKSCIINASNALYESSTTLLNVSVASMDNDDSKNSVLASTKIVQGNTLMSKRGSLSPQIANTMMTAAVSGSQTKVPSVPYQLRSTGPHRMSRMQTGIDIRWSRHRMSYSSAKPKKRCHIWPHVLNCDDRAYYNNISVMAARKEGRVDKYGSIIQPSRGRE
jgi:hypothetical protein